MRGLSFLADGEFFAVDVTLVEKVVRKMSITPVPSAPDAVAGIANMKGRVVTVMSLSELLGTKKKRNRKNTATDVNAVVFKTFLDHEDQLGLIIDKPGNLIDLSDDAIRTPPLAAGPDESFCISGITEEDDKFYRIINLDSIRQKYTAGRDPTTANTSFGGIDND